MMASDVYAVLDLVDRTLEAGGPQIDEAILIRSLVHRGSLVNIANYPDGQASLDEARDRAEAAGQWYEASRAPFLHASAAAESFDLAIASDYAHRALVSAVRHELPNLEAYAKALIARVAELRGEWDEAADLVREVLETSAITQMVAMPVLGGIEARRGRALAQELVQQAWDMASTANEMQRLAPAAIAVAEYSWISGSSEVAMSDLASVMMAGLDKGFSWSSGRIAFWLWQLGELDDVPDGIAEPFRLMIAGEGAEAAAIWQARGAPYERALALMLGSRASQLQSLELLETLGATAVAGKLRKSLRDQGLAVPRGKGRETRRNIAGLTARQAEVLQLLAEDLSNIEIADRLFVSPSTVENHVSAVLDKLDVSTREEAVSRARADGLLGASSWPRI
jgi:DNA-binding CsgD family transcriptional regulator